MSAVLTRTLQTGLVVVMGFIFAALAQASVTTNVQTMGITVTLPEGNEITNNLHQNIKDYAHLSLQKNLQIARHLFKADWSVISAANDNMVFQVSLNDDTLNRNQEPVPAGNMTHLLWGVTYCRKRNELMRLHHANSNENTRLAVHPMQDEDIDQQMTCLKEYIIQCPTSGQATSREYEELPVLSAMDVESVLQSYMLYPAGANTHDDDDNDDGTGGNNRPHTYDPRPVIFCPACSQGGCKASLPPYNPELPPIDEVPEDTDLFALLFEGIQASDESKDLPSRSNLNIRIADNPAPSKPDKKKHRSGYTKQGFLRKTPITSLMLRLLYTEEGRDIVRWVNKDSGVFQIVNSTELTKKWEKARKGRTKPMTWDKMSRAIRRGYRQGQGAIQKNGINAPFVYQINFNNGKVREIIIRNNYN